jgi:hypothetical protein
MTGRYAWNAPGGSPMRGTFHGPHEPVITDRPQGRGPDGHGTFSVEVYKGKVWVMSFGRPAACEAILEPAQVDSLVEPIHQTTEEARGYKNGSTL